MRLLRAALSRLLKMVAVVLAIVVVNFLLIHAAPGDPASVIAGQSGAADAKFVAQLREQFGLDRPLPEQLWIYMRGVLSGDLGMSHRQQRTVAGLIGERLPATLLLTGVAFAFALAAGIALGAAAARRAGRWADSVITVLALGFYATPIFWVGLMLVLVFSVWLGWLPSFGMSTVGADLHGWAAMADTARYLVLPSLTLGLFYMAVYATADPRLHAGGRGPGLRAHRPRQGRAGGAHPAPPHPAQRPAAHRHLRRHTGRATDRRVHPGGGPCSPGPALAAWPSMPCWRGITSCCWGCSCAPPCWWSCSTC